MQMPNSYAIGICNIVDRSASPFGLTKAIFTLFCVYLSVKPQLVHLVTSQAVIIGGFLAKFLNINSVVFSISGLPRFS